MSMYVGIHKFPQGTKNEDVQKNWENYKRSAIRMGINPVNAVSNAKRGLAYCFTEARSEEQVRKAHSDAKVDIKDVVEVIELS